MPSVFCDVPDHILNGCAGNAPAERSLEITMPVNLGIVTLRIKMVEDTPVFDVDSCSEANTDA